MENKPQADLELMELRLKKTQDWHPKLVALGFRLARMPRLQGPTFEVKLLGGGLTNINFKLDTGREQFVLRVSSPETAILGIDRIRELACLKIAAQAGVGAEVVESIPEHNALLTGFFRGRTLEPENFREPAILPRVVKILRHCHDQPVTADLATFSPFGIVRHYHALAKEKNVPLPDRLDRALELLAAIEKELNTDEPPCLCHNDLIAANFLDDGQGMRLIDWEYGGLGDRFFDLGNLAVNVELSDEQERALLVSYFGEARPDHLRRLRLMRLVSDMREATWGFVQAGIANPPAPEKYLGYGNKHLERFLAAAQ